jgi:hypothetical protein
VLLLSQYRFTKTRNTFILLSRAFGGLICTAISNFSLAQGIESPPTSAIFHFVGEFTSDTSTSKMADNQRRSRRRSREPQQQISRHPRNPSIDATSMDSCTLAEVVRDAKKHSTLLAHTHIDFAHVTDAKLYTLFLSGNERLLQRSTSNGAIIHPPIALRRTAKQIRDFYEAGLSQKTQLIDQYKNVLLCTSGMITYLESEFAPQAATPFFSGGDSVAAGSIKSVSFAEDSSYKSLTAQESCRGISIEYISAI